MGKPTDVISVSMTRARWASLLTIYAMGYDAQAALIRNVGKHDYQAEDRAEWEEEQQDASLAEQAIIAALQAAP